MPIRALLRRNWAIWAMPLTGLTVAIMNNRQLPYFDNYPYWMAAQKTGALVVLGMIAALTGAAEGSWQRRADLLWRPSARPMLARFGLPILLTWLPTASLLMVSVIAVGGLAAWELWLTSLLSLLAWTCLGFAVGVVLRPAVALPVAVLLAFFWFAFTHAMEPPWLRHLSAEWGGCCGPSDVPSTAVLSGVLLVASCLIATSAWLVWVTITRNRPWLWWAACLAPIPAGLIAAGALCSQVGYSPEQPRTGPVVCWDGEPRICLWPERRAYAEPDIAELRAVLDHWRDLGVVLPSVLAENARSSPQDDAPQLVYNHSDTPAERTENLALGLANSCHPMDDEPTDLLGHFVVKDWLVINSGTPQIDDRVSDREGVEPLLRQPEDQQVREINRTLEALWTCS